MNKITSYLVRNTVAWFIKSLCEDENKKEFLNLIENKLIYIEFKWDKIVNVRMNCTLILFRLKKLCKNNINLKLIVIKIFKNNIKNNLLLIIYIYIYILLLLIN